MLKFQNSEVEQEAGTVFSARHLEGIVNSAEGLDRIQKSMPVANMNYGNAGPTGPASGPSF